MIGRTLRKQLFAPEAGVEYSVWMDGVDSNAICSPFKSRNTTDLGKSNEVLGADQEIVVVERDVSGFQQSGDDVFG